MRADFPRPATSDQDYYRLLTALVVPRPIAWVSSTSKAGVDNLAPHSFFTVASVRPPIIQFTSVGEKDTLRNVKETHEFVVNLASEDLLEQVNASGTDFPPDISEFDALGLKREPSRTIRPPRVAKALAALECRLHEIVAVGDSHLVLGEVLHAVVSTNVLNGNHPEMDMIKPLARLGRHEWGTSVKVIEKRRIAWSDWPGDFLSLQQDIGAA